MSEEVLVLIVAAVVIGVLSLGAYISWKISTKSLTRKVKIFIHGYRNVPRIFEDSSELYLKFRLWNEKVTLAYNRYMSPVYEIAVTEKFSKFAESGKIYDAVFTYTGGNWELSQISIVEGERFRTIFNVDAAPTLMVVNAETQKEVG